MSDNGDYKQQLSEFAKLIAEGKKEKLENDKKVVAETKKRFAAKYDLSEKILDSAGFIDELFGTSPKKVQPIAEEPKVVTPEPTPIIEDVVEPIVTEEPQEVVVEPASEETIISKAVKSITKVAENTNLMSTTPVDKVDPNFKAVQDKLKYLEQWIGKISSAGPGSGSYWLNDLGDTDKSSLYSATDGQVLTYNESTRKWYAADPTGSGGGPTSDSFARLQANTAFDEANTAVQLALAAYDYANTIVSDTLVDPTARADILVVASYANAAFIKANTISEYAIDNTARTLAQNAYDFANTITVPSVDTSAGVYANGAFIKANSATTLAQQAYDYANTIVSDTQVDPFARLNSNNAYLQANTPSYTANSAALYANGAFDRANASLNMSTNSQLQITDVKNWSNSASSYANSAFIQANAAFIKANTPDAIANSAALYANGAFTKANSGVTLAQQAYDYANTINAGTLTGTTLNSTVVSSSLTSVGTLTGLNVNSSTGGNFFTVASSSRPGSGTQTWNFWTNTNIGGPASWIEFPDGTHQTTAFVGTAIDQTPRDTANAAFTQANAAFLVANTPSYTANSGALYANAAFIQANAAFIKANTPDAIANSGALYANSAYLQANIAFNTANGAIANTGGSITGRMNIAFSSTGTGYALSVSAANTQGGTGYADFLKVTNSSGGATNTNKTFRMNSTGGIEIINSAYSASLMILSDTGQMSTALPYQVAGKQAVNGPAFSAYPTSPAQTIASGSQVRVNLGNEEYDIGGCYDAPNGKFQPNVEGYYQLNATVRVDGSSGTGERMLVIYKNGTEHKRGTNESGSEAGSSFFTMTVSCIVYANGTTDYFQLYVQQGSGGNRTISEYQQISYFQGCMLRGA
jgi:hypothetical protein